MTAAASIDSARLSRDVDGFHSGTFMLSPSPRHTAVDERPAA